MPVFVRVLVAAAVFAPLPQGVLGAPGEVLYRTRCALCHDSGATQAPRVSQPNDWRRRVEKGRAALLRSALEGVRDTAMLPRAGFPDLSNARVDDATLVASVAEALRTRVLPRAKVEGARVGGITVEASAGRIALRGMVDSVQIIRAAEDAARGIAGVTAVDNHLIPADLFEHD